MGWTSDSKRSAAPDRPIAKELVPTELDEVDDEPDLVADPDLLGTEDGPFVPAEEAAMHVVEDAPGATDHPDDDMTY